MMSSESNNTFRISESLAVPPTTSDRRDYLISKFRAITTITQVLQQSKLQIVLPPPTTIHLEQHSEDYWRLNDVTREAQDSYSPASNPHGDLRPRDRRLRILDALSTLLIRDHEIVAVAMGLHSLSPGNNALELLATESSEPSESEHSEVEVVAAANPRRNITHKGRDKLLPDALKYSGQPNPSLLTPTKYEIDICSPLNFVLNNW